jgi:predicted DNA-binding transcriptional regulator AlpA
MPRPKTDHGAVDARNYLTTEEVARELRIKPQTLMVWRCDGRGPDYVKIGGSVRYPKAALAEYVENNTIRRVNYPATRAKRSA